MKTTTVTVRVELEVEVDVPDWEVPADFAYDRLWRARLVDRRDRVLAEVDLANLLVTRVDVEYAYEEFGPICFGGGSIPLDDDPTVWGDPD